MAVFLLAQFVLRTTCVLYTVVMHVQRSPRTGRFYTAAYIIVHTTTVTYNDSAADGDATHGNPTNSPTRRASQLQRYGGLRWRRLVRC